jgi:Las1-like
MLSAYVIRFVNGISDQLQARSKAQSVRMLAARVDLPRLLVDVRHEATHTQLPSLEVLELAVSTARLWLIHHYWKSYQDAAETLHSETGELLKSIKRRRVTTASTTDGSHETFGQTDDKKSTSSARINPSIQTLTQRLSSSSVLVTLVPQLLSSSCLLKVPKKAGLAPTVQKLGVVFTKLHSIWHSALVTFSHTWHNFARAMLLALVRRLPGDSWLSGTCGSQPSVALSAADQASIGVLERQWHNALVTRWIMHFISAFDVGLASSIRTLEWKTKSVVKIDDASPSADELSTVSVDATFWMTLLEVCLRTPNAYTVSIASRILHILRTTATPWAHVLEKVSALLVSLDSLASSAKSVSPICLQLLGALQVDLDSDVKMCAADSSPSHVDGVTISVIQKACSDLKKLATSTQGCGSASANIDVASDDAKKTVTTVSTACRPVHATKYRPPSSIRRAADSVSPQTSNVSGDTDTRRQRFKRCATWQPCPLGMSVSGPLSSFVSYHIPGIDTLQLSDNGYRIACVDSSLDEESHQTVLTAEHVFVTPKHVVADVNSGMIASIPASVFDNAAL